MICYADDTQLYTSIGSYEDRPVALAKLELCIKDIHVPLWLFQVVSTHLKSITAFLNIIHLWVNKILVVVVVGGGGVLQTAWHATQAKLKLFTFYLDSPVLQQSVG